MMLRRGSSKPVPTLFGGIGKHLEFTCEDADLMP